MNNTANYTPIQWKAGGMLLTAKALAAKYPPGSASVSRLTDEPDIAVVMIVGPTRIDPLISRMEAAGYRWVSERSIGRPEEAITLLFEAKDGFGDGDLLLAIVEEVGLKQLSPAEHDAAVEASLSQRPPKAP